MSDIAVSVRGLSKSYRIAHEQEKHVTLAETMLARLKDPLRRPKSETFWALKDINFDIKKGDVVGIIGRNGAGKSTLLKILSRITEPTSGRIDLYGRVGSLLEVGTGFHPELTGRENIFLNGAILGMSKAEIKRQFDAIVDFAGVEQFLDTPVKRYSSGMYVRLAFAVASHLRTEVLIVDEVLAVGDGDFQNKCIGKMRDVSSRGRTVLIVSHQLETVTKLCNKGILLEEGRVTANGGSETVISAYLRNTKKSSRLISGEKSTNEDIVFDISLPRGDVFDPDEAKAFTFSISTNREPGQRWFVSGLIRNDRREVVVQFDSRLVEQWFFRRCRTTIDVAIRHPWLRPGLYTVDAYICVEGRVVCSRNDCAEFTVSPRLPYPTATDGGAVRHSPVLSDFTVAEVEVN